MAAPLDFRPLTDPTRASGRSVFRQGRSSSSGWERVSVIGLLGLFFAGITFIGLAFERGKPLGVLIGLGCFVGAYGVIRWSNRAYAALGQTVESMRPRLSEFAFINRWYFRSFTENPQLGGSLLTIGSERTLTDYLSPSEGRSVGIGTYEYKDDYDTLQRWGFLMVQLDRSLPHIVLESTANRDTVTGALPFAFDRDQIFSLEGDFDQYFTLYCPAGFETDALYVLTPDLMALLVDEVHGMHVEIKDDFLYVYSRRDFLSNTAEDYARLFRIVDVVGSKAVRQTGRYVDERSLANAGIDAAVTEAGRVLVRAPLASDDTSLRTKMMPVVAAAGILGIGTACALVIDLL
jgi:hypothetical protein